MNLLDRYIIKTILVTTFIVILVLFGVSLFIEMSNELRAVGRGDYTVIKALIYVILTSPNDLYIFFPMAGLLGALVGLGILASNGELVSMRAAGMSIAAMVRTVIVAACILSVMMAIVGEGIVPILNKQANSLKTEAMYGRQVIATKHGLWMRIANDFINVKIVVSREQLNKITRYQFDDQHKLKEVNFAESLLFTDGVWQAQQVRSTVFLDNKTLVNSQEKQAWHLELNPDVLDFGIDSPSEMSLISLFKYIHYREDIGLQNNSVWLIFWQRAFQPLAVIVMIILAMPFVFGSVRSGVMGHRLLVGIIWGLSFYFLTQFFGQLSLVYNIPAIFGASLPIVIFAGVGLLLMKRVK